MSFVLDGTIFQSTDCALTSSSSVFSLSRTICFLPVINQRSVVCVTSTSGAPQSARVKDGGFVCAKVENETVKKKMPSQRIIRMDFMQRILPTLRYQSKGFTLRQNVRRSNSVTKRAHRLVADKIDVVNPASRTSRNSIGAVQSYVWFQIAWITDGGAGRFIVFNRKLCSSGINLPQ